ncbi:MAG: tyrosine-type recombinase/integrase [Vulcanimicrobiota bacterium]
MSPTGKKGLYALTAAFIRHLHVSNYAPGSIEGMKICVEHFARYLEDRGLYEIRSVTKSDMEDYLIVIREPFRVRRTEDMGNTRHRRQAKQRRQMKDYTICNRWRVISVFFRFLVRRGYLLYNPAAAIDPPRVVDKVERKPLTLDEMEALLSSPDVKKRDGLRDRALLELLYSTGLRKSELMSLEIFDVDIPERTVRIRKGKGRKERVLPLGEVAASYLQRYLEKSRPLFCRGRVRKALFLGKAGLPLCAHGIDRIVKIHAARSGLTTNVTPHIIRHTCASHLLAGGADIFSIQKLLGHSRAEYTQRYLHSTLGDLRKVHEHCHPRGKSV